MKWEFRGKCVCVCMCVSCWGKGTVILGLQRQDFLLLLENGQLCFFLTETSKCPRLEMCLWLFKVWAHIDISKKPPPPPHPPCPWGEFATLKDAVRRSLSSGLLEGYSWAPLFGVSDCPIPGDSPKNMSGLSPKNDLVIWGHWPFYLINCVNCITSCTSHIELVASKPNVTFAARSSLVIMVCFCSHIPGSVLCCVSSFISNCSFYTVAFYISFLKRVGIWINKTFFPKHSGYSFITGVWICCKNFLLTAPPKKNSKEKYWHMKHPSCSFPFPLFTLILLLAHRLCQVCLAHPPSVLSFNLRKHLWWHLLLTHLCHTQNLPDALRVLTKIQSVLRTSIKCTRGRQIQMKFQRKFSRIWKSVKILWP